jgi:hypothetical protein
MNIISHFATVLRLSQVNVLDQLVWDEFKITALTTVQCTLGIGILNMTSSILLVLSNP